MKKMKLRKWVKYLILILLNIMMLIINIKNNNFIYYKTLLLKKIKRGDVKWKF